VQTWRAAPFLCIRGRLCACVRAGDVEGKSVRLSGHLEGDIVKLAALFLVLTGSLLIAERGYAQDPPPATAVQADPGYSSGPLVQPAGSAPASSGGIKDRGPHQRPMMASAQLYTPWRFGFGVGLKLGFEIPIVHDGFIPQINNSFSIEPNFAFAWNNYNRGYGYGAGVLDDDFAAMEYTPGVSVLWSFYFSERFRAYAAVHTGLTILKPYYDGPGEADLKTYYRFHGELAPGVVWSLNEKIALRAELGWWSGVKGGIALFL
jgi:hypothetical protein